MMDQGTQARPSRKRRLWKLLSIVAVVAIVAALALPGLLAPFVRGKVVDGLEEQLNVKASIEDLSFSLGGSVHLAGFVLEDLDGRLVASMDQLDASLSPLSALFGTYNISVLLDGMEVHAHEEEDGSWNLQHLVRDTGKEKEDDDEKDDGQRDPLDVSGPIELRNIELHIHGREGNLRVSEAALSVEFHHPTNPARFEGSARIESGSVKIDGWLPGDPGALLAQEDDGGVTVTIADPIDLSELGPALRGALGADLRSGRVSGGGQVVLRPGPEVVPNFRFALDDLEVVGPREGASPLRLASVQLLGEHEGTTAKADVHRQTVTLTADDALKVVLDAHQDVSQPGTPTQGTLAVDGDLGRLASLADGWVAFRAGLELAGALVVEGSFDTAFPEGALGSTGATVDMRFDELAATDAVRGPIDLGTLADARFGAELRYDPEGDSLTVPRLSLTAGPVQVEGNTALSLAGAAPELGATRFDLNADLDALGAAAGDLLDLGELSFAGQVQGRLDAVAEGASTPIEARLETRGLAFGAGAERTDYGDLLATLKADYNADAAAATLDELRLSCQGLDASGTGSVAGLDRAEELPDATVDLTLSADPSNLPGWVHELLGDNTLAGKDVSARLEGGLREQVVDLRGEASGSNVVATFPGSFDARVGSLKADFTLAGPLDTLHVVADAELVEAELHTEAEGEDAKPIDVSEPRVQLALDALVGVEAGDVELTKLQLESKAARGTVQGKIEGLRSLSVAAEEAASDEEGPLVRVQGLTGDLTYVPDLVAAALGPLIPGELSGADPEPCRFQLDGEVRGADAAAVVEGLEGTIDVGVGRYRQTGLDVGGAAKVELARGEARVESALKANGGELKLDGELSLVPGEDGLESRGSRLVVNADGVEANSGLGPLLSYLHPAFSGLDSLNKTEIGGVIQCDLELRYDGVLSAAALAGGWDALPKEPIQGSISFGLDEASLVGSPLIADLLGKLNLGGRSDFSLDPIEVRVVDGRVTYDTPWEWSIRGAKTSFGGSIGLDKTLDLKWSIPVTDEVVKRNDFLGSLRGQTLDVGIGGSITRPKIDSGGLLTGLAKNVVKSELQDALESLTGAAKDEGGNDPKSLLKRADDLWDKGQKVEAAKIYREIKDKHKVSLVYAVNSSRIKKRAKYKKP
ncbi:MAG: hypothetical protein AAF682_24830 [Planctomycetota bacterium]